MSTMHNGTEQGWEKFIGERDREKGKDDEVKRRRRTTRWKK